MSVIRTLLKKWASMEIVGKIVRIPGRYVFMGSAPRDFCIYFIIIDAIVNSYNNVFIYHYRTIMYVVIT